VVVLPENGLGWNDVGSWDSLFDVIQQDGAGNILFGDRIYQDGSSSSLIFSENREKLVVGLGISDLIVVDTGQALLICHRSQAQHIRDLVKQLKENGFGQYL
ncbi:MAG: mannose-1-phosphate guanylyltransferase, partial [Anaerolineaceae bacterium]|nr:mannose-1-phosphate guanylyltransferase [Anaerolineaceae bacterium]